MSTQMFYYGHNGVRYKCPFSKENIHKHYAKGHSIILELDNGAVITVYPTVVRDMGYSVTVFCRQREGHYVSCKQRVNGYRQQYYKNDYQFMGWSC